MPCWLDAATHSPPKHGWYPVLLAGDAGSVPGACWWTGKGWAGDELGSPTHWWPDPQPAEAPAELLALDVAPQEAVAA